MINFNPGPEFSPYNSTGPEKQKWELLSKFHKSLGQPSIIKGEMMKRVIYKKLLPITESDHGHSEHHYGLQHCGEFSKRREEFPRVVHPER